LYREKRQISTQKWKAELGGNNADMYDFAHGRAGDRQWW